MASTPSRKSSDEVWAEWQQVNAQAVEVRGRLAILEAKLDALMNNRPYEPLADSFNRLRRENAQSGLGKNLNLGDAG